MWYGCTIAPGDPAFEPHHVTQDRQEDRHSLVRICRQYDISITTYIDLYNEGWRNHSCNIAVLSLPNPLPLGGRD
jgi:hypothetical protein